jgi:hypothetical protein
MAKLTNLRMRCTCAHCGTQQAYWFSNDEDARVGLPKDAVTAGWLALEDSRLMLCAKHAETVRNATVDEIRFLRYRLDAHEVARSYALPFIIVNERLISESDERRATAAEVFMWQIFVAQHALRERGL